MAQTPPVPVKSQAVRSRTQTYTKGLQRSDSGEYVDVSEVDQNVGWYEAVSERGNSGYSSLPRPGSGKRKMPLPPPSPRVDSGQRAASQQPQIRTFTPTQREAPKETFLTEGMTLPQFVEKFSDKLPLRIKVLNGYLGDSARETISTDDIYNVHFIKHCEVVVTKDIQNTLYSIPINTSFEFGLVYDSKTTMCKESTLEGRTFEKVSEILALQNRPHALAVRSPLDSGDDNSSFSNNEVLLVKQVQKARFKKKGLKVYSVTEKKDKFLPEDCICELSTHPNNTKMHLSDIVEHLKDIFPCEAIIFPNVELYQNPETASKVQNLPSSLVHQVVDMQKHVTETSLIVSAVLGPGLIPDRYDPKALIDIPLESVLSKMINIAVLEWKDVSETEKVYDDTRSIYEKFNQKKVKAARSGGSDRVYMAQTLFYTALKPGCEGLGLRLETPTSIYEKLPLVLPKSGPPPPTPPKSRKARSLHEKRMKSVPSQDEDTTESTGYDVVPRRAGSQQNTIAVLRTGNMTPPHTSPTRSIANPPAIVPPHPAHFSPSRNSNSSEVFTPEEPTKPTTESHYESISTLVAQQAKGSPQVDSEYEQIDIIGVKRPPIPIPAVRHKPLGQSGQQQLQQISKPLTSKAEPPVVGYEATGVSGRSLVPQPMQSHAPESAKYNETRLKELENRLLLLEVHYRRNKNTSQEIEDLKKTTAMRLKDLEDTVEAYLQQQQGGLSNAMSTHQPQPRSKEEQEAFEVANRKFLERLNVLKVQNVLEAMDLRQYQEAFSREHITGELMLEVDDTVLQTELGITTKLHRIRLMKLVNGQYSAEALLSGTDPYGTLSK